MICREPSPGRRGPHPAGKPGPWGLPPPPTPRSLGAHAPAEKPAQSRWAAGARDLPPVSRRAHWEAGEGDRPPPAQEGGKEGGGNEAERPAGAVAAPGGPEKARGAPGGLRPDPSPTVACRELKREGGMELTLDFSSAPVFLAAASQKRYQVGQRSTQAAPQEAVGRGRRRRRWRGRGRAHVVRFFRPPCVREHDLAGLSIGGLLAGARNA